MNQIFSMIRRAVDKMFSKDEIGHALGITLGAPDKMRQQIELWGDLYEGNAPWVRQGAELGAAPRHGAGSGQGVKSLGLPAAVASELARLCTIELRSELSGSARADYLNGVYQEVIRQARVFTEYACAKGGLCLKPYYTSGGSASGRGSASGGRLAVDAIQADCFYPLAQGPGGMITEAVFFDRIRQGGKYVTRLEYHKMEGEFGGESFGSGTAAGDSAVKGGRNGRFGKDARGTSGGASGTAGRTSHGGQTLAGGRYLIKNRAFVSESAYELGRPAALSCVPAWADIQPDVVIENVERPLFAYFKMPFANTVDAHSPVGVSCYARAAELFEQADRQYTRLLWEFESGQRALYVDETAFRRNPRTGEIELPDERLYRTLDMGIDAGGFFQDFSPNFREQSILNGMDSILMRIEDSCGLARGTFSHAQETAKTATELKILRQRSYATVADTQKALKDALTDLTEVLDIWASLYKLAPDGKIEASFEFDDSIVTDRSAEFEEKKALVEAGIMQPWELRMWYFGESEEAAKQRVGSADKAGKAEEEAF